MNLDFQDEQLDSLKMLFNNRLSTKAEVEKLCEKVGLSVPTVYRYKKEPELIPYGMYLKIKKFFTQLENTPDYILPSPDDFIRAEERRLSFEQACANGERFVVTPMFTVTCEIEEFTRAITTFDYPEITDDLMDKFVKIRQNRRKEYDKGNYKSYELIDATKYRDFFLGVNRFVSLSRKCIEKQIEHLISTMDYENVERRIYLYNTPELPIVSCYKVKTREKDILKCIIRADEFVAEYSDEKNPIPANELYKIFLKFYEWSTNIKEKNDIIDFFKNPMRFPMF